MITESGVAVVIEEPITDAPNKVHNEQHSSEVESVIYNCFKLGEGSINIPNFLSYKGESDDGGLMFGDNMGKIRLFADYFYGQNLESYHWWVTNKVGNGNPEYEFSKGNFMVQSGYNHDGEIYYAKWYMDSNTSPLILYSMIMIYPQTEKDRIEKFIPKMFNKFPNLK